jgi:hypothetical protein
MSHARSVTNAPAAAGLRERLGDLALARPTLVILCAALVIWAPTLLIDFGRGDSLDENLVWSTGFSRLFAHGHLYPHWLPAPFGGLGSPSFNYYPPLPFWTTALVTLSGWASPMLALKLAALAALAVSGLTMRLWLGRLCAAPRALLCALIYMAAPYHLIDHYMRGAFAEFFALSVLPLVPLGLAMTADRSRFGPAVLAIGYALLLFSHLPMALIGSVMLAGPYGLFLLVRMKSGRVGFAVRVAAGLAVGAGLAAIYLAPALGLEDAISADYLWRLKPGDHLFTNLGAWGNPFEPLLALMAVIEAAFAAMIAWSAWRGRAAEGLFWPLATVAVFAALSGLIPGFWSLPLMGKVQFAWRAMGAEEFALVTAIALSPAVELSRLRGLFLVLALANPGLVADLKNLIQGRPDAQLLAPGYVQTLLAKAPDAPEYLPRGMLRIVNGDPRPVVPLDTLAALPLATSTLSETADPVTGAVSLQPTANARLIVLRRFHHPSWAVTCDGREVAAGPVGAGRLLGFSPAPGAKSCLAKVGPTPLERLGDGLAIASLALLLGYLAWAFSRRPTPSAAQNTMRLDGPV